MTGFENETITIKRENFGYRPPLGGSNPSPSTSEAEAICMSYLNDKNF